MEKSTDAGQAKLHALVQMLVGDKEYTDIFEPFLSTDNAAVVQKVQESYPAPDSRPLVSVVGTFQPSNALENDTFLGFWTCFNIVANIDADKMVSSGMREVLESCGMSNTPANRRVLAMFGDDAEMPAALGRILEDLSGAVRVIVRFKEDGGDDEQRGIFRGEIGGGGSSRVTRFSMDTRLFDPDDKTIKQHFDASDGSRRMYQFGPFFNVSAPDTLTNRDFAQNILETDRIVDMITDQNTNVCLMTYGYSGSGKTYSLYGTLFDQIGYFMDGVKYMCLREMLKITASQKANVTWQEAYRQFFEIEDGSMKGAELDQFMAESEWEELRASLGRNTDLEGTFDNDANILAIDRTIREYKDMFVSKIAENIKDKLFDAEGRVHPDAGSIVHIINAIDGKDDYDVGVDNIKCLYGYARTSEVGPKDNFTFHIKPSPQYTVHANNTLKSNDGMRTPMFIVRMMMDMYDAIMQSRDEDSFIKSTINNPRSSRGFLFMKLGVTNLRNGKRSNMCIVDMAGNEDPFDLMLSMAPLMYVPSAKYACAKLPGSSLLQRTRTQSTLQRTVTSMKQQAVPPCSNFLVDDNIFNVNIVFYALRKVATEVCEEIRKKNAEKIKIVTAKIPRLTDKSAIKEIVMELFSEIHQGNASSSEIMGAFKTMTTFACYLTVWGFFRNLYQRKTSGESRRFVDKVDVSTFGPALKRAFHLMDASNLETKDMGDLVAQINNTHAKEFKYFSLAYSDGPDANEFHIDVNINCRYFNEICKEFAKTEIRGNDSSSDVDDFYTQLKRALFNKNVEKATSLALQNYVNNDDIRIEIVDNNALVKKAFQGEKEEGGGAVEAKDNFISLLKLFSKSITIGNPDNMIQVRFNDQEPVRNIVATTNSFGDMQFVYPKQGAKVSPSFLYRILREAYFINQANLELKDFLLRKREDPGFTRIRPHSTATCAPDIRNLYLENYDTFESRMCAKAPSNTSDNHNSLFGATSLLDSLVNNAEGGATTRCKYIMVAAIRKENSDKFRSGAIDTLKLLELLKT